jgi:hypothetical protein
MSDQIKESIVLKLGKEGVKYLEKNGELPAIKLTSEEMEFMKGGWTIPDFYEILKKYKLI